MKPVAALSAIAFALVAGILGTVMHQTNINGFPFGVAGALCIVLVMALNLRENRAAGWIFFAIFAAFIFFTGMDIHEDKMIPANLSGYIWSYGSVTIAAFVAMFPKFRKL